MFRCFVQKLANGFEREIWFRIEQQGNDTTDERSVENHSG
jgi:hypothetical protein